MYKTLSSYAVECFFHDWNRILYANRPYRKEGSYTSENRVIFYKVRITLSCEERKVRSATFRDRFTFDW